MARSGRLHLNVSGEESLNLFLFVVAVDLSASLGKILGQYFFIALDVVPVFLRLFSPSFLNTCKNRKDMILKSCVYDNNLSSLKKDGFVIEPRPLAKKDRNLLLDLKEKNL